MAILKCVVVICYAHADSIGCSMVGVGYSILLGISLITGEYGINAYEVMNLIEAGTPVCDRILFSSSGIPPQVSETTLQKTTTTTKTKK